jgi:site-specific DNA-methyltransferase (adenine-specific)
MRELPESSADSVITDPPYGLSKEPDMTEVLTCWLAGESYQHSSRGFLNQEWDSFIPGPEYWREAMRVLKPGGHLVAFSAPRCYDVLVMALRLSGFEIRDCVLAWTYGQGMPKSHSVSKNLAEKLGDDAAEVQEWAGWGTGLKPAQEPIVVARKPLSERSVSANMLKHRVGAININATRVGGDGRSEQGRWPANFVLAHHPGCQQATSGGCVASCPVNAMDDQARTGGFGGEVGVSQYFETADWDAELPIEEVLRGNASAANYCPKPSVKERDAGLAEPGAVAAAKRSDATAAALRGRDSAFAPRGKQGRLNPHTTVKPAGVMMWLATLVTPAGGTILDPFCGSGSTGVAVALANSSAEPSLRWSFIGIEADFDNAGFVETARKRIRFAAGTGMREVADDTVATLADSRKAAAPVPSKTPNHYQPQLRRWTAAGHKRCRRAPRTACAQASFPSGPASGVDTNRSVRTHRPVHVTHDRRTHNMCTQDGMDEGAAAAQGSGLVLPKRLSPGDLTDYSVCPRKVWLRRGAHIRLEGEPNATLMLGNAVHAALYLFFGLPPEQREPAAERLHACLRHAWREHCKPSFFASVEEERAYGQRALELLTTFALRFTTESVPLAREQWVTLKLPNGVVFRGKTDRVDGEVHPDSKGSLEVIDYKTGRVMLDDDEVADEPAAQMYLLATEQMYNRQVHRVRFIYLTYGQDARWEPEREDVELVRERLLARTDEMLADRVFEPRPGAHCARCVFSHLCPDAGRVELTDLEVDDELVF